MSDGEPTFQIEKIYVKDLSLELPNAPQVFLQAEQPQLEVQIARLRLANPLILASGIADETGASMAEAVKRGAGGVVTKSLSLEPRDGHPNPCIVELPYGLLNALYRFDGS